MSVIGFSLKKCFHASKQFQPKFVIDNNCKNKLCSIAREVCSLQEPLLVIKQGRKTFIDKTAHAHQAGSCKATARCCFAGHCPGRLCSAGTSVGQELCHVGAYRVLLTEPSAAIPLQPGGDLRPPLAHIGCQPTPTAHRPSLSQGLQLHARHL